MQTYLSFMIFDLLAVVKSVAVDLPGCDAVWT
jgi:hypothetical protein